MARKRKRINKEPEKRSSSSAMLLCSEEFNSWIKCNGYRTLDKCPEVVAGCLRIAQLIASMTIHLKRNGQDGDERIINELSRKIDIQPHKYMTRTVWMTAIVMNLLLYGKGNSVVFPHTNGGLLGDLTPINADRVQIIGDPSGESYKILIDGVPYDPESLLHFVYNPDRNCLFKGQGLNVSLADVCDNLAQAQATKKAFMSSKWMPPIIVKVDALTEEFASKEGRANLLDTYLGSQEAGQPWMIPAEQFSVESVRPLTLQDLAINEAVDIDKKTVASILGIPPFLLGVGQFNKDEWNSFINTNLRPIVQGIEQEMTRKLVISPKMYLTFNMLKLYSYDLKTIFDVFAGLYDKGLALGNEVRDQLSMEPLEGLDQLVILENYIPVDKIGDQSKLQGEN